MSAQVKMESVHHAKKEVEVALVDGASIVFPTYQYMDEEEMDVLECWRSKEGSLRLTGVIGATSTQSLTGILRGLSTRSGYQ